MATLFKFAQLQPFALTGSGASLGDTSIILQSMTDIDGNVLSMSGTFGAKGFGTLEPGNGALEEQIVFTGLTNNTNGTVTLSGVSTVDFVYPYTETSGLAKTHAGNTSFVISNTSGYYNQFVAKDDDGTISEVLTFTVPNYPQVDDANTPPTDNAQFATKKYVDDTAFNGAPDATTSVKGIIQLPTQAQVDAKTATGSTGASLAVTPDTQRSTLESDYVAETGATATITIASPAVVTLASHGLSAGSTVTFSTTGALPTGITAGTKYFVISSGLTSNTFEISATLGGSAINTSGSQSGTQTLYRSTTYILTPSPALSAYTAGQVLSFKANNANTGTAPTVNANGLGTKTIVKQGSSALAVGDIGAGAVVQMMYDGTNFQLLSLLGNSYISQNSSQIYAVDSGTANAYAATVSPALTAYSAGLIINLTIANASTGASTLNVSGLGTKTIKKLNGTADITKNDLLANNTYQFIYDGTNFITEVPTQSSNGTLSIASNSGDNVVTTGFKPRIIRFAWQYKSSNTGTVLPLTGYGTYINGTYSEVYSTNTGSSGGGSTANVNAGNAVISGEASSDNGTFSGAVGTLTDTGFTLTMTNATGSTPTVVIAWEAQS